MRAPPSRLLGVPALLVTLAACHPGTWPTGTLVPDGGGSSSSAGAGPSSSSGPAPSRCGDGAVGPGELCDDGNTVRGDGCGPTCIVEAGYACAGVPSACSTRCGDGMVAGAELCDDGNTAPGDGCDGRCHPEPGSSCDGAEPSHCVADCGDGSRAPAEQCDDGNTVTGDGCGPTCAVEEGFTCPGAGGPCSPVCGDRLVRGHESCDDGGRSHGDGCDGWCVVEPGYACTGSPSLCFPVCGDGAVVGDEECDDGAGVTGDGCDDLCRRETGYRCQGQPSRCVTRCGDGLTAGAETCDDGNTVTGDGCGPGCGTEAGFTCQGTPSRCATTCGDGIRAGLEACDDGNDVELDGCSTGCQVDGVEEAEVNDTPAQANGPWSPGVLVRGRIRPRTDVDHLATTLTSTSDVVWETFDGRGPGHCTATDTLLQVLAPDGVQVLGEDDDGGLKACSRVVLRHLPPGRYVARVSAPQPQVMVPSYTLLARTLAVCGNGTVEGVEECDGTPGCDASCDRVPRCGDRWVDAPETCDDGDDQPGDGCDGSCRWEAQPEVEPNDTPPLASGPFLLPALLAGAVTPAGDVDLFSITLATVSDLHVRTTGVAGSCDDMDTVVTLLGPDGVSVLVRRDQGGEGNCAVIDPGRPSGAGARHLAPGTYLLRVEEFLGDHQVPGYLLLVTTPAACGNGVVEGGERCDGTPGCTSTCDRDPLCGDGWVDPPETCDDGNTVGGDRCGATCAWEYVVEEEPNDDPARATGPRPAPVLFRGDIPVGPDVDWYAATLAAFSDLTLETFDGLGPGSCVDLDTVVTLLGPDGSTVLGRADDGGIQTCSRLHVTRLPPGTYRIRVEDFGNDTALGPYALEVLVVATCGNGVVEGSEQCDATAGCSQACARIPTCGDRHVDVPETCDDGNTLSQDGCDAACTMELTPEVEPNDDLPGARSQGLFLSRDTRVSGSLGSAGDRDWFLLGGPVEVVLHAETVGPDGVTCPFDSTLRLLDENATTTLYEDDNHGIHTCSALTVVLPPGMYVLEVAARTVVPAYVLEVVFHGGGTLEQEPNDTPLEMQVVAETRVLRGSHGDNLDVDLFAVPVPEGGSLRLEVVEGDAERCEDGEVDSLVTLYDPTGETLGWDDDGGRGFCSLVDGTGWPPAHPFAHGLPGGLYVVGVEAAPFAQGDGDSGGQFDYRLVITVR